MAAILNTGASASNSASAASSQLVSITPGALDNFLLCIALSDNTTPTQASGVTYNGVALTHWPTDVDDASHYASSVWYMVNPPTGVSHLLTATFPGVCTNVALCGMPFSGVNLGAPLGTTAGNSGSGTTKTVTASGATASDVYIASIVDKTAGTITGNGTGQSAISQQTGAPGFSGFDGYFWASIGGSNPGAFSWTGGAEVYLAQALAVFGAAPTAPSVCSIGVVNTVG